MAARDRTRSANELLGLLLLPLLVAGGVTGGVIWGLRASGALGSITIVVVHAYAGLASVPLLIAKVVAGVRAWRTRRPRADRRGDRLATVGLMAAVAVLYGTGIVMYANTTPGGNAVYKQVHLVAALTTAVFVTHHLVRYLRRSTGVARRAATTAHPEQLVAGRRAVLRLGALGLLGLGGLRGVADLVGSAAAAGPNDFPVTVTAGGADAPDPSSWRLRITGDVDRPLEVGAAELHGVDVERHTYPLDCVIGWSVTREWGGMALAAVIEQAAPAGAVRSVVARSTTGYEVALPADLVERSGALVAWEVDGVPLTAEHGWPARLMVPGVVGELCVKWLAELDVITEGPA